MLTRARAAREELLKLPEHRTRIVLDPSPVDDPRRPEHRTRLLLPDPSPVDIHRRRRPRLAAPAFASALAPAPAAAIASAAIAAAAITLAAAASAIAAAALTAFSDYTRIPSGWRGGKKISLELVRPLSGLRGGIRISLELVRRLETFVTLAGVARMGTSFPLFRRTSSTKARVRKRPASVTAAHASIVLGSPYNLLNGMKK